jgi:16S rRNA (adenine1518-N6/adenine1519-N6)-dimethyltransferase
VRKAFRPKKRHGQHFLYDPAIARKVLASAQLSPRQAVIELGAGKGILTKPLAELGVRLVALEIDADLCRDLKRSVDAATELGETSEGHVEILNVDFTKVSITGLLATRGLDRCVLIGNIPYHLTRDVLFSFLVDEVEMLDSAYLMMQREVGERIVSAPGSRVYGITSVILQSLYAVRALFKVSPGSFNPKPKVASVVLEFKPLEEPLVRPGELGGFTRLVKNLFQQRRKTIHNTIRSFYGVSERELQEMERIARIDFKKRPEALSKEEFLRLSRAVAEVTSVA